MDLFLIVSSMVKRGADVNGIVRDAPRQRPIEQAARGGHENVVSYLLAKGAEQDEGEGPIENDAITAAAANDHLGTVKILLRHDADINSQLERHRCTPLHEAARNNHVKTLRFLLKKGAALDVMKYHRKIFLGYEALERAIKKGHKEIVRALVEGA
jgi:ankyrin repeat protein